MKFVNAIKNVKKNLMGDEYIYKLNILYDNNMLAPSDIVNVKILAKLASRNGQIYIKS